MEASQPRVKPTRASEPEQSLTRQSPPPVGDANVRELPQRPLSVAEPTPPTTKRKSQSKGNRASQRKPVMAFRQHWVGQQQLLADEMQQLESQAERINQRLAERAALQSEARSPRPTFEPDQSRSIASGTQPDTQPEVPPPTLEDEEADRLQSKMAQVWQIASDLGAAIAEGENLTKENGIVHLPANPAESPPTGLSAVENDAPKQASSRGANSKGADPGLAEQEAAQTAATLRHLAERARSTPSQRSASDLPIPNLPTPDLQLSREFIQSQNQEALRARRSRRRRKFQLSNLLQLPQHPLDRVVDALTWIVLAGVVRIGVRFLLMAFPVLSPVAIGLMLLPVAIGLFLLLFVPKAGYLPIYRLFLVTLGLLLGGKL